MEDQPIQAQDAPQNAKASRSNLPAMGMLALLMIACSLQAYWGYNDNQYELGLYAEKEKNLRDAENQVKFFERLASPAARENMTPETAQWVKILGESGIQQQLEAAKKNVIQLEANLKIPPRHSDMPWVFGLVAFINLCILVKLAWDSDKT